MDNILKTLLVRKLLEKIIVNKVEYCCLDICEKNDQKFKCDMELALLVSSGNAKAVGSLLNKLGFVQVRDNRSNDLNCISEHLGIEEDTGETISVKLYESINLGIACLNNYHIPIESSLLGRSVLLDGVKKPDPELELVLFVMTMVLKRRALSQLVELIETIERPSLFFNRILALARKDFALPSQGKLDALQSKADQSKLAKCLEEIFPSINEGLFDLCISSLKPNSQRFSWFKAGSRLASALKPYRRYSSITAFALAVGRTLKLKINDCFRGVGSKTSEKKFLAPSGKIIAFMGGDGSGKSSNIQEFQKWFGQYFNVRVLHVGKPAKGPMWYGVGVILKLRKMLLRIRSDNFHESVKYLMVAWYRHRAFQKAVSLRSKGVLVCLDRFPLPGMKIMEAPQIRRLTGGGGIYASMASLEDQFHSRIRGADEIFALMLDPSIARMRRPEDEPQELRRRCCEILHRDWPDKFAHLINASKSFDEVVLEIRKITWGSLNKTSRVIEVIGPAGSGKTSVARKLTIISNCIKTSVSWHDYRLSLLIVIFRRFSKILSLAIHRVPVENIKEIVGLEVDLDILLKHKDKYLLQCRDIILEVGPVFKLAKLIMDENIQNITWMDEISHNIVNTLDLLVWIDAPNEILQHRVNSRAKEHIVKHETNEVMCEFFEEYRKCFAEVIDRCNGNFPVKRFDTSKMTVDEISDAIRGVVCELN